MKTITSLVIGFLLFACHPKSMPEKTGNLPLENTEWKLVALSSWTGKLPELQQQPFFLLKDNKVSGFSGCNKFFGGVTHAEKEIHFSAMGMTKMYCANTADLEQKLMQVFSQADQFVLSGSQLELFHGSEPLARFAPQGKS